MSEIRLAAEARTEFGKGAARRARRAGFVPGVVYGHGHAPVHLNLPGHDLMMALKTPNALLVVRALPSSATASYSDLARELDRGLERCLPATAER